MEQKKLYKSAIEKLKEFNRSYENGEHAKVKKQNSIKNGKSMKNIEPLTNDMKTMNETKESPEDIVK